MDDGDMVEDKVIKNIHNIDLRRSIGNKVRRRGNIEW